MNVKWEVTTVNTWNLRNVQVVEAETRREAITLVDERTNGAYLLVDAGLLRSSVTGDLTEGALDSVVIARGKWATSNRFDWSKTENIALA